MGQSQSLSTDIEIQASPAAVRSVFMDFPRYKDWTTWTIGLVNSAKNPSELKAEDQLKVNIGKFAFSPYVMENSAECFVWEGRSIIFSGKHRFEFTQSQKNPEGTLMIQNEVFRGPLAFLLGPGWRFRKSSLENWETFLADLKKEVERS